MDAATLNAIVHHHQRLDQEILRECQRETGPDGNYRQHRMLRTGTFLAQLQHRATGIPHVFSPTGPKLKQD